ncbi:MAG: hypothetical protein QNJ42_10530 [Crocosphaera sp.]|nr:hypothetical protein [Crocosphaera sp.]
MIRPRWLVLLLATSLMVQSCGQVEVPFACNAESVSESSPLSDSLDIMIAVDGSQSMLGYVSDRNSRYVQTLKLLDDTLSLSSLRSQSNSSYYRSGKSITRSDFKKAQLPEFYNSSNPNFPNISVPLQEFILPPNQQDSLLVMVTDLDQADGDVTIVNQKIKDTYLNNNNKDYVVGVWGIKSEFSGTVHVQEQGRLRKFNFPNSQSTESLRPFYVIIIGRYEDVVDYFKTVQNRDSELLENSELTLFSPYKIVDEIAYLDKEVMTAPSEEQAVAQLWKLEDGLVKVQAQDKKNQLWDIPSQQTGIIIIEDSVNLRSDNPITELNSNSLTTIKTIQMFEKVSGEFKNAKEIDGDGTSFKEIINIDQWEVIKDSDSSAEKLKFITTIDANKFPNPGLYSFEIDVVLKNLPEENWWQQWNLQPGQDHPEDGSKTQNLLNFMRGLKTITSNLMADNPPKVARFCYVFHKK